MVYLQGEPIGSIIDQDDASRGGSSKLIKGGGSVIEPTVPEEFSVWIYGCRKAF